MRTMFRVNSESYYKGCSVCRGMDDCGVFVTLEDAIDFIKTIAKNTLKNVEELEHGSHILYKIHAESVVVANIEKYYYIDKIKLS